VTGQFVDAAPLRLLSTYEGGSAWLLLQEFVDQQGGRLLVGRGKVPTNSSIPPSPTAVVTITGHVQMHDKGRGFFDVDNDPAQNLWYHWDVAAMTGQATHNGEVLHLVPGSPGTEGLFVDPPKSDLRNNHLGYAITWFGLAAVLIVMTAVFLWTRMKT
jgi:surfeit locus 1 family protein